jgi:Leucine-rich repeat (LRR) protein
MSKKVASSQSIASHDNQTLSSSYSNSTLSNSHGSSYYHVKRNFVKNQRVKEEFQFAKLTQMIMISHCGLTTIPEDAFQSIDEEVVKKLRRFDCSNNHIPAIPPYILNTMQNLREIWINNNPINYFPQELLRLSSLEAIDISNTQISEIPLEIIELTQLIVFDWRKTPLAKNLLDQYSIQVNDLSTLKDVFMDLYRRKATKKILFDYLFGEFYVMDADKKYTAPTIAGFIEV